jgi:predicted acyltransferase
MSESGEGLSGAGRSEALDEFRGLAIIGMVAANFLAGVASVPAWFKHAPDSGLTVIDLVAPFFVLAMGAGYSRSLTRRMREDGALRAAMHFLKRFLSLIALGFLINIAAEWVGAERYAFNWGVLQALGFAGILCLPLVRLPAAVKAALGLAGLAAYQYLSTRYLGASILSLPHGGVPGAFSWACMLLLSSALMDGFEASKRKELFLSVAGCAALALALSFIVPISKNRVSASYVLVSLGIGLLLFLLFYLLCDRAGKRLPLLGAWGRNPLLFYLLHYVLFSIWVLPGIPWWYSGAVLPLALCELAFILALLSLAAVLLDRKEIRVSL